MANRIIGTMPLQCPHGHLTTGEIIAVDWAGPLFVDHRCPQCSRTLKRVPFTAGDLGHTVTDHQLEHEIGEDAQPAFAYALGMMFAHGSGIPKSAIINLNEFSRRIFEARPRIKAFLKRLQHWGFLEFVEVGEDSVEVSIGAKISLNGVPDEPILVLAK